MGQQTFFYVRIYDKCSNGYFIPNAKYTMQCESQGSFIDQCIEYAKRNKLTRGLSVAGGEMLEVVKDGCIDEENLNKLKQQIRQAIQDYFPSPSTFVAEVIEGFARNIDNFYYL